jgi:hypothetical protein
MKTHTFNNGVILALDEFGIFQFHLPRTMNGEEFKKFLVSFKLTIQNAKSQLLSFFLLSDDKTPKSDGTLKHDFLMNYGASKLTIETKKISNIDSFFSYKITPLNQSKLKKVFSTCRFLYMSQLNTKKVNKFQTNN